MKEKKSKFNQKRDSETFIGWNSSISSQMFHPSFLLWLLSLQLSDCELKRVYPTVVLNKSDKNNIKCIKPIKPTVTRLSVASCALRLISRLFSDIYRWRRKNRCLCFPLYGEDGSTLLFERNLSLDFNCCLSRVFFDLIIETNIHL